jgi:hypothetical protein
LLRTKGIEKCAAKHNAISDTRFFFASHVNASQDKALFSSQRFFVCPDRILTITTARHDSAPERAALATANGTELRTVIIHVKVVEYGK